MEERYAEGSLKNMESGIIEIENDDRNNSLQQCSINKYSKKLSLLLLLSFFALLQPQSLTITVNCHITSFEQPPAIHAAWLCERWMKSFITLIIIQLGLVIFSGG